VVPPHDGQDGRLTLQQRGQDALPDDGVLQNFEALLLAQGPVAAQQVVGHPDLSHVVQSCPDGDPSHQRSGQPQLDRDGLGVAADPLGVTARVGVLGLDPAS